jgi:hypothetical protein
MNLDGKAVSLDLRALDDDPRPIIELLSATSSDRDKWMIVGAFYRRKGNIHAALAVVTTMVQSQWSEHLALCIVLSTTTQCSTPGDSECAT